MSHPTWVCGLKHFLSSFFIFVVKVTPYVGVWIETLFFAPPTALFKSHPTWVCGLKQYILKSRRIRFHRHTLRGCVD